VASGYREREGKELTEGDFKLQKRQLGEKILSGGSDLERLQNLLEETGRLSTKKARSEHPKELEAGPSLPRNTRIKLEERRRGRFEGPQRERCVILNDRYRRLP